MKFCVPKIEFLAPLLQNIFNTKNIIILVGYNGSSLIALRNNKIINEIFIPNGSQENLNPYKYFFDKFKQYNILFLLDDQITNVKHELIPVLHGVVKSDPVEAFIKEHFDDNQVVAYNVYNTTHHNGEVRKTLICSFYIEQILPILNHILSNSLNFSGIYFLNLEFIEIIDYILTKVGRRSEYEDHLQIFAVTTKIYGIKIVIKHNDNILHIQTVEYPEDKSVIYIQGIIEQQISDCIIKFKHYTKEKELETCLITLTTSNLKHLLLQSDFENCAVVCVSHEELKINTSTNNIQKFSDKILCSIFSSNKKFIGLNRPLKIFTRLSLLNSLIFKPFIILAIILTLSALNIQFNIWQQTHNSSNLNRKYYTIANEYRKIREKYPAIKSLVNIADLYSLETILRKPFPLPFDLMDKFINSLNPEIKLHKTSWRLAAPENLITDKKNIKFHIGFRYINQQLSIAEANSSLNQYVKNLQDSFPEYNLEITKFDNVTIPSTKSTIPVFISFSDHGE